MNLDASAWTRFTLTGTLEAKLAGDRAAGFTQVMLSAPDLVGIPAARTPRSLRCAQAVCASPASSPARFRGPVGPLHAYKVDVAKAMLRMCRALGLGGPVACSSTSAHAAADRVADKGPAEAGDAGRPPEYPHRLRSPVVGGT